MKQKPLSKAKKDEKQKEIPLSQPALFDSYDIKEPSPLFERHSRMEIPSSSLIVFSFLFFCLSLLHRMSDAWRQNTNE